MTAPSEYWNWARKTPPSEAWTWSKTGAASSECWTCGSRSHKYEECPYRVKRPTTKGGCHSAGFPPPLSPPPASPPPEPPTQRDGHNTQAEVLARALVRVNGNPSAAQRHEVNEQRPESEVLEEYRDQHGASPNSLGPPDGHGEEEEEKQRRQREQILAGTSSLHPLNTTNGCTYRLTPNGGCGSARETPEEEHPEPHGRPDPPQPPDNASQQSSVQHSGAGVPNGSRSISAGVYVEVGAVDHMEGSAERGLAMTAPAVVIEGDQPGEGGSMRGSEEAEADGVMGGVQGEGVWHEGQLGRQGSQWLCEGSVMFVALRLSVRNVCLTTRGQISLMLLAGGVGGGLHDRVRWICLVAFLLRTGSLLWRWSTTSPGPPSSFLFSLPTFSLGKRNGRSLAVSCGEGLDEVWLEGDVDVTDGDSRKEVPWRKAFQSVRGMRTLVTALKLFPGIVNSLSLCHLFRLASRIESSWLTLGFGLTSVMYTGISLWKAASRGFRAAGYGSNFWILEAAWFVLLLCGAVTLCHPSDWSMAHSVLGTALVTAGATMWMTVTPEALALCIRSALAATLEKVLASAKEHRMSTESIAQLAVWRWLAEYWCGPCDFSAGRLRAMLHHAACSIVDREELLSAVSPPPAGAGKVVQSDATIDPTEASTAEGWEENDPRANGVDRSEEMQTEVVDDLEFFMRTTRSTCDAVLGLLAPVRPLRGAFLLVTRCPCLCAVMLQLGTHLVLLMSRLGGRVSQPLMLSLQEWSLLLALFAGPVGIEALRLGAMRREGTDGKGGNGTDHERGSRGLDEGIHSVQQGLDRVVENLERALELLPRETTNRQRNRETEAGDIGCSGEGAPRSGQDIASVDENLDAGMGARRMSREAFTEESKVHHDELRAGESEVRHQGESSRTPGGVGSSVEGVVGQVATNNEQGSVVQANGRGEELSREASIGGGSPKPGEGRNDRDGVVEGRVPNTRRDAGEARETSMGSQQEGLSETACAGFLDRRPLGQGDSTGSLGLDLDRIVIDTKDHAGHPAEGSSSAQRQTRDGGKDLEPGDGDGHAGDWGRRVGQGTNDSAAPASSTGDLLPVLPKACPPRGQCDESDAREDHGGVGDLVSAAGGVVAGLAGEASGAIVGAAATVVGAAADAVGVVPATLLGLLGLAHKE